MGWQGASIPCAPLCAGCGRLGTDAPCALPRIHHVRRGILVDSALTARHGFVTIGLTEEIEFAHWRKRDDYLLKSEFLAPTMLESKTILTLKGTKFYWMFWQTKDKEQQRFYLLPGMGGRAFRRKQKIILYWSLAPGLIVSGVVAWFPFAYHRSPL